MKGWALIVSLVLGGCSANEDVVRMSLPKALKEISGLAPYAGDLLAIADEKARIYQLSFSGEQATRIGAFGDPPVKGDFEGIAVTESADETLRIHAITSEGVLYTRMSDGPDDAFVETDTGIGALCEIEGLDAYDGILYVLCKTIYHADWSDHLVITAWDPVQGRRVPEKEHKVPWTELGLEDGLHPSGLVVSDVDFLVIAAREKRWVRISRNSNQVTGGKLPNRKNHPQAEGIAVAGGFTYIADEGKKRGTVTRYKGSF